MSSARIVFPNSYLYFNNNNNSLYLHSYFIEGVCIFMVPTSKNNVKLKMLGSWIVDWKKFGVGTNLKNTHILSSVL